MKRLERELNDIVCYEGVPYLEKMKSDYSQMLFILEESRMLSSHGLQASSGASDPSSLALGSSSSSIRGSGILFAVDGGSGLASSSAPYNFSAGLSMMGQYQQQQQQQQLDSAVASAEQQLSLIQQQQQYFSASASSSSSSSSQKILNPCDASLTPFHTESFIAQKNVTKPPFSLFFLNIYIFILAGIVPSSKQN